MRVAWFAGALCGAALANLMAVLVSTTAASGVVAAAATLAGFWIIEDLRRVRRNRREDERLARSIAYFNETGKWPTML